MISHNIRKKDYRNLYNLYVQLVGEICDYNKMVETLETTGEDIHYKLICVYDDNDILVGTATVTKCLDLTGDCRYYYNLENFVVDKDHRREGYGKYLMQVVEEYVKSMNGAYINFTSSTHRTDAHKFYHKMGYSGDYVKGFKKRFE